MSLQHAFRLYGAVTDSLRPARARVREAGALLAIALPAAVRVERSDPRTASALLAQAKPLLSPLLDDLDDEEGCSGALRALWERARRGDREALEALAWFALAVVAAASRVPAGEEAELPPLEL